MTDFEKYLNSEYERNLDEIQQGVTLSASEAFSRINTALANDYTEVMGELEAHYDDKALQGYMRGWKDGIRFLLRTVVG